MLKRKRVGLIVWGIILSTAGMFFFILGLVLYNIEPIRHYSYNSYFGSYYETRNGGYLAMALIGVAVFAGGVIMLVFGIRNAVKTTRYNNTVMSHNEVYFANCVFCGRPITCALKDFIPHRNYPEGYITCPFCRRPLSRNVFSVSPGFQPQMNYQPQNNYYPPQG